ncbi:response regulator receiver protein [Planococcus antarcticus DSM 14505]|uniref:histidine kinase n=1 Tax=Planococcus antarcticus DSM 14505 TaxID=1185653 RepID=A0ABM6D4U6_9BACL|nr:ATP-binding protein [Planococcus antarcticus]ANU10243.1 response regulator receiver protein [Planococcus antarcticus DSM 14505]
MKKSYCGTSIIIRIFCTLWVCFFFLDIEKTSANYGDTDAVVLTAKVDEVPLAKHLLILRDTEGTLEIDELLQPPHSWKFVSNEKEIPNGGLSSGVYWLRFTIKDNSDDRQWLLEVANSSLETVTLYSPQPSGEYSAIPLGNSISDSEKTYLQSKLVFQLLLPNEEATTFFLRVGSQGAMHLPLTIWEQEAFEAQSQQTAAIVGLLSGMSLLFMVYCIKWFFNYQQKNFLYLLLSSLSVLIVSSTWTEMSLASIWPELGGWNRQIAWVSFGAAGISVVFITKELVTDVLQLRWLPTAIKTMTVFVLFSIVLSFFSYRIAGVVLFFVVFLSVALSFGVSFHAWKKGHLFVASYAVALFLSIVALIVSFLTVAAILPYETNIQYGLYLVTGISVLFIANALLAKEKINLEKKEQLERQTQNRQLMEIEALKNANARKDELLAFTSNGLRTPLYGMIGIAESLQESATGKISTLMANQLNDLVASGKNMAHLVNEILDFSKLKQSPLPVHAEAVAIDELCNTVLSLCRPLMPTQSVKLYHTVPASLPKVLADPNRVQQILYNLVDNSIHHTHEGEIIVSAHVKGDQLEISVKDTGIGIQEGRIPSLFEWNIQQEKIPESQGLGLRITKNLVELQGGSLRGESQAGIGSTFSFTLPIHASETTTQISLGIDSALKELTAFQLADSILKQHPIKQSLHILVIESEEINRLVLLRQLISAGYQAFGVGDGKAAMQLLAHKPVELIVMDGYLTDMSGDELCRRIRLDFTLTELPILILSNVDSLREKKDAFTAGANDFLLKPCDKEEFLLRVETLANMRSLTQEITNMNYFLERNVKERTMALEITNMNLLTVNDEIQEIEKSRTEMLSAISHELGTPITLIHSYIQAVKESLIEENNPRYLDMIHKKLLLLERLTEDLVELTKYKSGNMTLRFEERELDGWLARLVDSMASDVTQSGRAFEFLGTESLDEMIRPFLTIDLDRLDQVISNILWNAVKHTSLEEGRITLSTEIIAKNNEDAMLDEEEWDGELVIRIADNGCGIKKEALPHIFDRFYKIDSSAGYKGSGLGLAIAKEIILAHKGQIGADSTEEKGSVFIIVLPLTFR